MGTSACSPVGAAGSWNNGGSVDGGGKATYVTMGIGPVGAGGGCGSGGAGHANMGVGDSGLHSAGARGGTHPEASGCTCLGVLCILGTLAGGS